MRPANSGTTAYAPGEPPVDSAQMQRYLRDEFAKLAAAINALAAGHLDKLHAAPAKPRDGDLRYASGPGGWDPGAGKGLYMFSTVWTLIKALP